jgi:hypothetical protein
MSELFEPVDDSDQNQLKDTTYALGEELPF